MCSNSWLDKMFSMIELPQDFFLTVLLFLEKYCEMKLSPKYVSCHFLTEYVSLLASLPPPDKTHMKNKGQEWMHNFEKLSGELNQGDSLGPPVALGFPQFSTNRRSIGVYHQVLEPFNTQNQRGNGFCSFGTHEQRNENNHQTCKKSRKLPR